MINFSKSLNNKFIYFFVLAAVLVLPFLTDALLGRGWVRIVDFAMLYIMLALGLNNVVGYAGLLDLGYIAFYAVGAYCYALTNSPHLLICCGLQVSFNFESTTAQVLASTRGPFEQASFRVCASE